MSAGKKMKKVHAIFLLNEGTKLGLANCNKNIFYPV